MPIYEDIARDLLEAIRSGRYPVGSLIPTELELAARYDVSRQTVRAAMQRLTELGAVSRRKGSGTRVETREPPQQGFQETLGSLADLLREAAATRREIRRISAVVMDRKTARRLGCQPGSRWLHVAYIRASTKPKAPPMAWVNVYVDESYGDALNGMADDPRLVCDLIAERYGVIATEVQQTVSATAIQDDHAKALDSTPRSPALEVIRRYLDSHGRLFEMSESFYPSGRYTVTSALKRVAAATATGRGTTAGLARPSGRTKRRT